MRLGMVGVVQVKWTDQILDEVFRTLRNNRPDLSADRLSRTRALMNRAIRDVRVTGHAALVGVLDLPDPDDRHVLAAAIRCGAQAIITHNLRDFPPDALTPYGIQAIPPDEFVLDLLDLAPGAVLGVLHAQQAALTSPPIPLRDLLSILENNGLVRSMTEARALLGL